MDLTTTTTATTTPTRIPDTESETPPRTQPIKPLSFTNGALKKHHHPPPLTATAAAVVVYKECLKNHAASLGGHALDGCGEFMPSPNCTPTDPTSLKCAACGCHRNFHRREHNDSITPTNAITHFLEFHRHQPPPRRRGSSTSPSPPPPPISSNYSYAAPHMLLALSTAVADETQQLHHHHLHQIATPGTPSAVKTENPSGRKRFRTKFSQEQKEKMSSFAEKLGWKMQRCDEGMVEEFCNEVGIRRGVLKVWMHNNKNTFGKREKDNNTLITTTTTPITTTSNNGRISFDNNNNNSNVNGLQNHSSSNNNNNNNSSHLQVSNNGSSSSS